MPATETNLTIEQGATFAHGWAVTVDIDGINVDETWTARAQVRRLAEATAVLYEFAATVNSDGSVVIGAPGADSSTWDWRRGHYDVKINNADETLPLRVAEGTVTVDPAVTR